MIPLGSSMNVGVKLLEQFFFIVYLTRIGYDERNIVYLYRLRVTECPEEHRQSPYWLSCIS